MIEQTFSIHDYIKVQAEPAREVGWPLPSPFTLRFGRKKLSANQKATIIGSGIYFISQGAEVVYLGKFRPSNKCIVRERWERHLQTITGRGISIGLGGKDNPAARLAQYLDAIEAPGLRLAIQAAYDYSLSDRFRPTGCSTTPNRLRFASENWDALSPAQGSEILSGLTFWFMRIQPPASQEIASKQVENIETRILANLKPLCNDQYDHSKHRGLRGKNTASEITRAVRDAATAETHADITDRIQLAG